MTSPAGRGDRMAAHECETPLDGLIQHRWKCKKCGTVWIVTGMDEQGNPEYEKVEEFYARYD